jgi:sarcosine oxidase
MLGTYDAVVLGTGGVGSAALFNLARRGLRVIGLDRFPAAHDRGSSHGQTRMIRQAYFEHPDYVPLVRRAFDQWAEVSQLCGRELYRQVGLLQVGPADGQIVPGVLASAARHGLEIERLTATEVESRWPGFQVAADLDPTVETVALFEGRAGYLRVEDCVRAHLDLATRHGADLRSNVVVRTWRDAGSHVEVETDRERFAAERLVITAGAWSGQILGDLRVSLRVLRKPQYWFAPADDRHAEERGCPAFLFETNAGLFYGFPQIDARGVKVAEHSGGAAVADPATVNRDIDRADLDRVAAFAATHLPGVTETLVQHAVCMYTMTPDHHFVLDRHPHSPRVSFAAGLSGHGFKFACVLGEALADLAMHGRTDLPIAFLGCRRNGLRSAVY